MKVRVSLAVVALVVLALTVAACGSSSSSSGTTETAGTESTGTEGTGTEGVSNESGGSSSAALAEAEAAMKPYIGHPSPFPVTQKLKEVPKGAHVIFVNCGTPYCALIGELADAAGAAMGLHMTNIKAGASASAVASAFESAVAEKPAAVISSAINPELWKNQIKELQDANIPIATTGVVNGEEYGIKWGQAGLAENQLDGKLMADYVATKFGPESNVAVYEVPEIPFTPISAEAFTEEMSKVCPECKVRRVKIEAEEIGSTAPNTIVSDLQSNSETNVAVFTADEIETGLPSELQAAGIDVKTIGYGPTPTNLQYVKEGKETATLALDTAVLAWSTVDVAAREIVGQEPVGDQAKGLIDLQFLTPEEITFDPSKGWTGYPEFAEMFAELWGVKG